MPPKKEQHLPQKKSRWKDWKLWMSLTLSCIALGVTITSTPQKQDPKEILKTWLIETPTTFCPPINNREFWRTSPAKTYFPTSKNIKEMSARQLTNLLYIGTPTAAKNNGADQWETIIPDILNKLNSMPWEAAWDPLNPKPEPINLITTQIAANMAGTIHLLKPLLPTPTIATTKETLNSRIIKPYLELSDLYQREGINYWNEAPWIGGKDNWSAVCLANIAYTSLAINSREENIRVLTAVLRDIQPYLDSFENDGFFGGGIRYWEYGFGHFILLNELLIKATQNKINFYTLPKIQEAIHFPIRSLIAIGENETANTKTLHLNFGDNHGVSTINKWQWNILNRRFKTNYKIPDQELPMTDYPSLPILDLVLNPPKIKNIIPLQTDQILPTDFLFPESHVLISRTENNSTTLAIKGNHNQEENNHNQNDLGSYTIYHNTLYLTGDPGSGPYENAFGPDRFERPLESSYGHPVPIVDGQLQTNGRSTVATLTSYSPSAEETKAVYDLLQAYSVDGLKSLQREVTFDKLKETITIRDSYEASRPIHFETAIIQGMNIQNTQLPKVQVETSSPYKVKETYLDGNSQFSTIRRIGVELEKNQTGWIQYSIQPKKNSP